MTKIKIFRDQNGHIFKYEISGHADFDDYGKDILCAAISVLSQTSILALEKVCKISQSDIKFCIDEDTGYLKLILSKSLSKNQRESANIVLETMVVGLSDLRDQYPEHINIIEEEE